MKRIIFCFTALVMLFAVTAMPLQVFAYEVGEIIDLNANSVEGNSGGNSNNTTKTKEQADQDENNSRVQEEIENMISDWTVNKTEGSTDWYYYVDRGVYAETSVLRISVPELISLKNKMLRYQPGYEITNETPILIPTPAEDTVKRGGEEQAALKDIFQDNEGTIDPGHMVNTIYTYDDIPGYWYEWYVYSDKIINGPEEIISVTTLVPFDIPLWTRRTIPGTATYIQDYIYKKNALMDDKVNVIYLKSYSVQDVIKGAAWVDTPLTWYGSPHTHFWSFDHMQQPGDTDVQTLTKLAGAKSQVAFYHEGDYHVTATQLVERNYYNMLTYTVSEYLVLPETGQVIWQKHSQGGTSNNDAIYQESYHWLSNAHYYRNLNTPKQFYVTVFDEVLNVTGNDLPENKKWKPNTPFGNYFTSVRIK